MADFPVDTFENEDNWTQLGPSNPAWSIDSGTYRTGTTVGASTCFASAYIEKAASSEAQYAKAQYVTSSGGGLGNHVPGLMLRRTGVWNDRFYWISFHVGYAVVKWYYREDDEDVNPEAGSLFESGTLGSTFVAGDWMGAEVTGTGSSTEIKAWKWSSDPGPRDSWGSPDYTFTNDPGLYPADTGLYIGLCGQIVLAGHWHKYDNFTGGPVYSIELDVDAAAEFSTEYELGANVSGAEFSQESTIAVDKEYIKGDLDDKVLEDIYKYVLNSILDNFTPEMLRQYNESTLFKSFIEALALEIADAKFQITQAVKQLNIQEATSIFLNLWSNISGLSRKNINGVLETDDEYRARLLDSIFWDKISNSAMKESVLLKLSQGSIISDRAYAISLRSDLKDPIVNLTAVPTYLFIVDTSNCRILQWSAVNYSYISQIGSFGAGINEFSFPQGITLDSTHMYICDTGNNRIVKRRISDLGYVSQFGALGSGNNDFNQPIGICNDGTYLYITDYYNNRVKVHQMSNLSYVDQFGTVGSGDTNFLRPAGITTDGSKLYICDAQNRRMKRHDISTFAFEAALTSPTNWYWGIDNDGTYLYVTAWSNILFKHLMTNFSIVTQIGSGGSGDNQFNTPHMCAVLDDIVFVCDTSNNRIKAHETTYLSYSSQAGTFGSGNEQVNYPKGIATFTEASNITDLRPKAKYLSNLVEISLDAEAPSDETMEEVYNEVNSLLSAGNVIAHIARSFSLDFLDINNIFGHISYGPIFFQWNNPDEGSDIAFE